MLSSDYFIQELPYLSFKDLLFSLPAPLTVLKSSGSQKEGDRYSIYAFSPSGWLRQEAEGTRACFASQEHFFRKPLHQVLASLFPVKPSSSFLPFTGGALGFFSYEYGQLLDNMGIAEKEAIANFPRAFFYFYDEALVVDELKKKSYWISCKENFSKKNRHVVFPSPPPSLSLSPFFVETSREAFLEKVKKVKAEIARGEIYQANISLLFRVYGFVPARLLFFELFQINPSPFSFFMETPFGDLVSCSPERLVAVTGRRILAGPIAGTHPRGPTSFSDEMLKEALLASCKEKAEHVMLVDLCRNDIGKIARIGSVFVKDLYRVESYSHVHHIVSEVQGELQEGAHPLEAFTALFPGGTITGCPKIRATEIIAAVEERQRHFYTGSFGYINKAGNLDFNIIIRTLLIRNQEICYYAGAGIVHDSVPEKEYEEILAKQEALRWTLQKASALVR